MSFHLTDAGTQNLLIRLDAERRDRAQQLRVRIEGGFVPRSHPWPLLAAIARRLREAHSAPITRQERPVTPPITDAGGTHL